MLVLKLPLVIKRSFLKKQWKNIIILAQNLVSSYGFIYLIINNNLIYDVWYFVIDKVFSFLSQDEVEKMKLEEGI